MNNKCFSSTVNGITEELGFLSQLIWSKGSPDKESLNVSAEDCHALSNLILDVADELRRWIYQKEVPGYFEDVIELEENLRLLGKYFSLWDFGAADLRSEDMRGLSGFLDSIYSGLETWNQRTAAFMAREENITTKVFVRQDPELPGGCPGEGCAGCKGGAG